MENQVVSDILARLNEFGITLARTPDLTRLNTNDAIVATLTHEYGSGEFFLAYSDTLTSTSQHWKDTLVEGKRKLLLMGPRITERSAEIFRLHGINYVDQAGNAFIEFQGIYIDVRGRRAKASAVQHRAHTKRGGVNLFSLKRSQIIFSLLNWPELLSGPIRHLAFSAGTSLGQTQETLELLSQFGFLNDQRSFSSRQRESLIDQWAAAYPTGLGSLVRATPLSGDWGNLHPSSQKIYISGEPATPYLVHPETVVLYTTDSLSTLVREHRWRRDANSPNIFVRRKFWVAPDETPEPGVFQAPLLLVYADLLSSNDSRQIEAAQQMRETKL